MARRNRHVRWKALIPFRSLTTTTVCLFFQGSHGRDNKLHVWKRVIELPGSARLGDAAASLDLPIPDLSYSMDVNALNYCRFSLMLLGSDDNHKRALLAVPGLIDSSVVGGKFQLRHR